jgi:hypothetical protein
MRQESFPKQFRRSVSCSHTAYLKWRIYKHERALRTIRRFCFVPLLVVVNACGGTGTSEPRIPLGPSLLITNTLDNDKVYVVWNDASGARLGTDSVGPRISNRCVRLRPVDADSAQWTLTATELVNGVRLTSTVSSYWFHPGDVRAAEALVMSSQQASPNIVAWDSASAVNGPVFGQTREVPPHC